jgi:hypothetical protein
MKKTLVGRLLVAVALALSVFGLSLEAQAAPVITSFSCTQGIQQIVWDGGALYIDCIGQPNRFAAFENVSPCAGLAPESMDTIKLFQSLATSAMISGKLLIVTYATPASCQGTTGAVVSLSLSR